MKKSDLAFETTSTQCPCQWSPISEPVAVVLGCGSVLCGEHRRFKVGSPVAESEPIASQKKLKSSITSLREDSYPFLHNTCPNPRSAWPSSPQEHPIPGDAQAQAKRNKAKCSFLQHRILFTSMLCSSTRAVCPSLGELGLTYTSWPPGPKLTGTWGM